MVQDGHGSGAKHQTGPDRSNYRKNDELQVFRRKEIFLFHAIITESSKICHAEKIALPSGNHRFRNEFGLLAMPPTRISSNKYPNSRLT